MTKEITILIVEDETLVAQHERDLLEGWGYRVFDVASGEEALQAAAELEPDLVLMDIGLPGEMDGVDAAEQVRTRFDIPVVFVTVFADDKLSKRARVTEPFGYVLKPFPERELQSNVEMALYKHRLEQKLRSSEARYRAVSELGSDLAYSIRVDPDGTLTGEWGTDAFVDVTGYTFAELVERGGMKSIVHPDDSAVAKRRLETLLSGRPRTDELRIITKIGEVRWLRIHGRPVWGEDPARVVGLVAAARDVTKWVLADAEREDMLTELRESNRRLEEALAELRATQDKMMEQERLAAVGQLAAGIAHDFNNMMASITLYSDLMLTTSTLSPTDRDRVKTIRQEGWRAADLTQQMLDFGRRSLLRREEVDLAPFVKGLEGLLESTLAGSGQLLVSYGAGEMVVDVDRDRLRQVLLNLALNAREAMTPKGGGALRIGLERVPSDFVEDLTEEEVGDTEWIELTVADTGTGIPDDVMPHIFEPFFTTRSPMGSGLGLSQVYGIVKQHDGHIDVNTVLGQGTIFTIYLPALPSSEPAAPSWAESEVQRGEGETILVVESSSIMRQALEECMEMLNYRVLTATGGREALKVLEQHQRESVSSTADTPRAGIALALISLTTSGLQGLDWYVESRGDRPAVVVISDFPLQDTAEQLAAAGVVGWLRKPVNLDRLAETLARALEGGAAGGQSEAGEHQTVSPDKES